jgi:hypothetical protein
MRRRATEGDPDRCKVAFLISPILMEMIEAAQAALPTTPMGVMRALRAARNAQVKAAWTRVSSGA